MLITDLQKLKRYYSIHRVWQGIPGIARTKGGRTFISFYSGDTKETYGNYALLLKSDTDTDFGEPIAAVEKPGNFRVFDPVLWIDPLDRLWFIWNVMPGEQVMAAICQNPDADVLQWSEPQLIGRGIIMNKPVVLSTGEWLFPIAIWQLDIYPELRKSGLLPEDVAGSYVYKTSDCGRTFQRLGMADNKKRSFDEHMVYEQEDGTLKMLVRTTYGIGAAYSYDRGKNWSKGESSGLGGPCSRFFIGRLRSGRLLLINHYNFKARNNLTAFLSDDDGKTFPHKLLLDGRSKVSYPDAMEGDDGYIYIAYDRERGCFKDTLAEACADAREILTCKISEADILAGELVTEGSFLQNVVSKLTEFVDPDPYVESVEDVESFARQLLENGGEDIVHKVFDHYPINWIDIGALDAKHLDELVAQFQEKQDLETLLQLIHLLRTAPNRRQTLNSMVDRIKSFIQTHLQEDISVAYIAEQMNMSVYYMSYLFKSVTGTTVEKYRDELRLTRAKLMLIRTDDSISQIARSTGFTSVSHFTEAFVRSEAISPDAYRKYHQ